MFVFIKLFFWAITMSKIQSCWGNLSIYMHFVESQKRMCLFEIKMWPKIQDFNENVSTAKSKRLKCYFHELGEKAVLMLLIWNLLAPQTRNSLVITSFIKKSAWREEKVWWDSKISEYSTHHHVWKCWKIQSSHVLEEQIISTYRMASLFSSVCSLDTILHYTKLFGG